MLIYDICSVASYLPEHVVEELKKLQTTGQFATWDLEYNHVYKEIRRFNDSRMSKWNLQRLTDAIKPKAAQKINHIGSEQDPRERQQEQPVPVPDMASMQANIERMVAAAIAKTDRGRSNDKSTPSGSRSGSVNFRNSHQKSKYRALPSP